MNEAAERPPEKVCDVDDCNAWKEGEHTYCHHHKGLESGRAEEGNQRATRHGLYAVPEYLREHWEQDKEDRYHAYFEALCSRYERLHGREPDAFAKERLSRVTIECVKERIADEYLSEQALDGNILVEEQETLTEQGLWNEEQANKILSELTALKRETRLTLKDMGLLNDPSSQQADAMEKTLAEVLSSE